jgi:hypothetical protein
MRIWSFIILTFYISLSQYSYNVTINLPIKMKTCYFPKAKLMDYFIKAHCRRRGGLPIVMDRVRVMVFNTTFKNISAISWRSVSLMEEIRVPEENLSQVTDNHYHIMLY